MTELTSAIVETLHQPVLVLQRDLTVILANRAFLECFEVDEAETVGRPLFELGNGQWDIAELRELLDRLRDDGADEVRDYRVEHNFESIGRHVMLINARRLREELDRERLLVAITDVTERERLQNELIARAEFSEKLIDSVREALLVLTRDLVVETANQSFYQMFEVSPEEVEGRLLYEIGNGQWEIPALREALEEILPQQESFDDFEVTHDCRRTMLLNGRQLDHMPRILLAIRDVTLDRRHQARQKMLVGELQHRVKNILANVQAMANSTARRTESLEQFQNAFMDRLSSLARTQDLLLRGASGQVDLYQLVEAELKAHGWEPDGRLEVAGPPVTLSRRETQALAMVLHELTTNAVKYGAFAQPEGRLRIAWNTEGAGDETHLSLEWRESGVELTEEPQRRGFGTGLVEQSIRHMLGGESSLDFTQSDVVCTVTFRLGNREH